MSLNYLNIGLFTSSDLGLIEIPQKETNYRRIEMGPGDWFFLDANEKNFITNAIEVKFPDATSFWGIITHFGIFDSSNDEKLLEIGAINKPDIIYEGCKIQFDIGKLKIPSEIFKTLGVKKDG